MGEHQREHNSHVNYSRTHQSTQCEATITFPLRADALNAVPDSRAAVYRVSCMMFSTTPTMLPISRLTLQR